jgi:DNA-binding transcriptional ArsR family regulator
VRAVGYVKKYFDRCRIIHLMACSSVVKNYSHPAMSAIHLHAVMQALSDPCRIAIVRELLGANGRALACIEVRLPISKATRSHHFEVLRAAGIIYTEMQGTKCMTSLRRAELNKHFPGLLKLVAAGNSKAGDIASRRAN